MRKVKGAWGERGGSRKSRFEGDWNKGRRVKGADFSHSKGRGNPQVIDVFTRACSLFVFPFV